MYAYILIMYTYICVFVEWGGEDKIFYCVYIFIFIIYVYIFINYVCIYIN